MNQQYILQKELESLDQQNARAQLLYDLIYQIFSKNGRNRINDYLSVQDNIVLYGCGLIGAILYSILSDLNQIKVTEILDKNGSTHFNFGDLEIHTPNYSVRPRDNSLVIITPVTAHISIEQDLKKQGWKRIITVMDMLQ